jgi:hypothetical protein
LGGSFLEKTNAQISYLSDVIEVVITFSSHSYGVDLFQQNQNHVNRLKEWLETIAQMPVALKFKKDQTTQADSETLRFLGTADYDFEMEKKKFPILSQFTELLKTDLVGSRRIPSTIAQIESTIIPGENDGYAENDERNAEDAI